LLVEGFGGALTDGVCQDGQEVGAGHIRTQIVQPLVDNRGGRQQVDEYCAGRWAMQQGGAAC